jgi:N-methylhydantoinase B
MNTFGRIHHAWCCLVQNLDSAAIADQKGQILFLKHPHPFDCGTWGEAFKSATKYFQLNAGDVVMFNDPFSGGNDYSVFSFITCLQKQQDGRAGIFLGHRLSLPVSVKDVLTPPKNIFRVPVTPVAQDGQIQDAFLEAMAASPMAPPRLKDLVVSEIKKALEVVKHFEMLPKELLNQKTLQNYLSESHNQALNHLKEKPWGETKVELPLDTGESIKMQVEMSETGIRLDFSGSSLGRDFFLPPGALAGICTHWISRYIGLQDYLNEGVFSIFQVSQPTQSCLAAKAPQSTTRGYKAGARILATALDMAMGKLHPRPPRGLTNHFGVYFQIQFPEKNPLVIYLPNGQGALGDTEGVSGLDYYGETPYMSAENIERQWPVRIHRLDLRTTAQGKGRVNGGRGLIYKLECLEKADIYWLSDLTHYRFPVQRFQSSPDRIEMLFENGEVPNLAPYGHSEVQAGEIITVGSASGGGLL